MWVYICMYMCVMCECVCCISPTALVLFKSILK